MYGLLYIRAVEVDGLAPVGVCDVRGEAEHVSRDGAHNSDLVHVGARVDGVAGIDHNVEDVAGLVGVAAAFEEGRGMPT